jgi:serine/threonine protein kinase
MDDLEDFLHKADSEPIPGYRLICPLGRGGFGEVWKCEAPGGLHKAIKFVHGGLHALDENAPAEEELRAIQRVKSIRHPFLLSMERVERVGNELVIVMELADKGLGDVLAAEQAEGNPGIERDQLLKYLSEAAEALDVLNKQYGLQHLDVKPQNLFLVSNHVKVGDFGLVSTLSAGGNHGLGAITPIYASPEVFQGKVSPHSDQYSLAIVYMELLTGQLPFKGKNSRMLMLQHVQEAPELDALPESDRVAIARALDKDPDKRFPSCTDLIHALMDGDSEITFLAEVDTRTMPTARTVKSRPSETPKPTVPRCRAGVLEVQELVSRSPLAEMWRATLPNGDVRLVSILFGCAGPGDPNIEELDRLRHPQVLPIEVLQHQPGRLILVQVPGERNLRDLMQSYQGRGLAGIPRRELLAYLRYVAQALDQFAGNRDIQHLSLNPRMLVFVDGQIRIAQFGLAQLVWLPAKQQIAQLNSRYSPPELHRGTLSEHVDQYSLALIFYEMLTGSFPSPAKPARRGEPFLPALERVQSADRMLLQRALNPDPSKRWESSLELIRALEQATREDEPEIAPIVSPAPPTQPRPAIPTQMRLPESRGTPSMQIRVGTSLPAQTIRERLEGFREQWQATVLHNEPHRMVLRLPAPASGFQLASPSVRPMLDLEAFINLPEIPVPVGVQTRTELRLELTTRDCTPEEGKSLLGRLGPLLAESIRQHLHLSSKGRQQERIAWHHPFVLCPLLEGGNRGEAIEAQGKDLSLNGIGFYVQTALNVPQILLLLPATEQTPQMSVPARIVRVQSFGDGWYEVGAVLLPPDELPEGEIDTL